MLRNYCDPHFVKPRVVHPKIARSEQDENLAKKLATEIAQIAFAANSTPKKTPRPCSLAGRAQKLFSGLSKRDRVKALEYAKILGISEDVSDNIDIKTTALIRRMARSHLRKYRRGFSEAIADVAKQGHDQTLVVSKTFVTMRPAGEVVVTPYRYTQVSYPPNQTFHWTTEQPGAERAYWELRGPASINGPGQLLDRGIVDNHFEDERVGGTFTLNMRDYFQPTTPNPGHRFSLRVLPLAGERPILAQAGNYPIGPIDQLDDNDPVPPAGVGPWSLAAVIDYGTQYKQPVTQFDEPTTYYKRARAKVNWFRVDIDQPGPGTEEYHLRAFFIDFSPTGTERMGS